MRRFRPLTPVFDLSLLLCTGFEPFGTANEKLQFPPDTLEWLRTKSPHDTFCKAFPILFVLLKSFVLRNSFAVQNLSAVRNSFQNLSAARNSFALRISSALRNSFDEKEIFGMKRAPPFGFEVVVDYKRIFRSWHIGAVKLC